MSNSIDLLQLRMPSPEEREAYWEAVNARRGDATRRPNMRPDGYAAGVSAQHQGLPAVARNVPAIKPMRGRGVNAQRGVGDQAPTGYVSTEHDRNVRPHLLPQGVNAQRGAFSERRPRITQRGGVAVQAHRDGVTSWRSEQGDYEPHFKPDYPAPGCSCHLAPGLLTDNDALPFDGGRLRPWLADLCRRIYRWFVLNRDWSVVVNSKSITGLVPSNPDTVCGMFLDPPYDEGESRDLLYSEDSYKIAADVRRWLYTQPTDRHGNPTGPAAWYNPRMRIVLAGYSTDFDALPDGRMYEWRRGGGMEVTGQSGRHKTRQEVLFANPACLTIDSIGSVQGQLF